MPDKRDREIINLDIKKMQLQRALGLFTYIEDTDTWVPTDEQNPLNVEKQQEYVDFVTRFHKLQPSQFIDALSQLNVELPVAKTEKKLEVEEVWNTLNGISPTLLGPRNMN